MVDNTNGFNYRSAVLAEPNLMPPTTLGGMGVGTTSSQNALLHTPFAGNVRSFPPPVPQIPQQYGYNNNYNNTFGTGYGGGYGGFGSSGFGNFGSGFGSGYGYGGYGYNRFGGGGMNPMDPESRFIQLAEASSRPAFQSIESLVSAIGNIAAMLDSTFFALTSSFRAILGVAANFGRLRGVFAQFWQTFAIFRGLNWIYRKILYWLRVSKLDPSSDAFKRAFTEALNETSTQGGAPKLPRKGQSPWPVLAFLSFIITSPYLIMKLLGTISNTAQEEARQPSKWVNPIETVALFDFQARNPSELALSSNKRIQIAPKEIQNTLGLLNTGWALATADGVTTGIIPINYVKSPQQIRQERFQQEQPSKSNLPQEHDSTKITQTQPQTEPCPGSIERLNLSANAFPSPPTFEEALPMTANYNVAHHPIGLPTIDEAVFDNGFA